MGKVAGIQSKILININLIYIIFGSTMIANQLIILES
jgi:hypothetical protein